MPVTPQRTFARIAAGAWFALARRRPHLWAVAVVLALSSAGVVLGQGLGPAGPTPAQGHAAVVAHGVVSMAGAEAAWRVDIRRAEVAAAPRTLTSPGFVLADGTPLLLTDDATGGRMRLASGEAAFVAAGQTVRIQSFGPPETFFLLSLAPATSSTPAAGDAIVFSNQPLHSSKPFPLAASDYDLDLVRDVLAEGERTALSAGAAPTLVLVTAGELVVGAEGAETRLAAGDAAAFAGPLELAGGETGATFVGAFLGAALPAVATPLPATPLPATPEPSPAASVAASPASPASPDASPETRPDTGEATPISAEEALARAAERRAERDTDSDGDGLTDDRERDIGTDPDNADTDEDDLNDGDEIALGSDPFNLDTDGDVLYDNGELVYDVDIFDPDTDNDGLPDGEEVYIYDTDPGDADSDDDGVNDFDEVNAPAEPDEPPADNGGSSGGRVDTDGDGLTDPEEAQYNTDPNDGDSDNDTVNDSNEVAAGTDPNDRFDYP